VQEPGDAAEAEMPMSALRHVDVDHVMPAAAMGGLLNRLTRERAAATLPIPLEIRLETAIAAQELSGMQTDDRLGTVSRFTCPECHGSLWEIDDGSLLRYRCHVGHAFTGEAVLDAHTSTAEEMLWNLLRVHRERAALARRMADEDRAQCREARADTLRRRALDYDEDAEIVGGLLRDYKAVAVTRDPDQEAP
jgi:two-component system, chemotaxis family, protein-glutamate methylesterase/glutaminase